MKSTNHARALWLPVILTGLMGGCSSGAHSTASRQPEPRPLTSTNAPPTRTPPVYYAQATCWDSESCCVERHPFTAVESCGADPTRVAEILKALESLYATAHPEAKEAADTDVAEAEQTEDWSSIAELPEWKQRCIKFYNACKDNGWTGRCDDCLRYCEGQHDWPTALCGPRKKK